MPHALACELVLLAIGHQSIDYTKEDILKQVQIPTFSTIYNVKIDCNGLFKFQQL